MNIKSAKYEKDPIRDGNIGIFATIDDVVTFVPITIDNRHYKAILEWVAEGNTIEEAD
jgi:translation initiation factor 6 (eIF-6)